MTEAPLTPMTDGKKIIGVAKSYRHAWPTLREDTLPEPIIFLKPWSSYVAGGSPVMVPEQCSLLEEVELAVFIGQSGRNVGLDKAMDFVTGYALAYDFAAGNVMQEVKANGTPWDLAKGLETFTHIGEFLAKEDVDPTKLRLTCKLNGKICQEGSTEELIYSIPQIVAFCSSTVGLDAGDVILTGTPAGQTEVFIGTRMQATLATHDGSVLASFETVVQRKKKGYRRGKYWLDTL